MQSANRPTRAVELSRGSRQKSFVAVFLKGRRRCFRRLSPRCVVGVVHVSKQLARARQTTRCRAAVVASNARFICGGVIIVHRRNSRRRLECAHAALLVDVRRCAQTRERARRLSPKRPLGAIEATAHVLYKYIFARAPRFYVSMRRELTFVARARARARLLACGRIFVIAA